MDNSFEQVSFNFEEVTQTTQSHLINSEEITDKVGEMGETIEKLDGIIKQFKGL